MSESHDKDGPHNLPMARVKAIVGLTLGIPASSEALYAFCKAAELFIEDLVKGVHSRYGDNVDYDELAAYILDSEELEFLHDYFPRRMTFKEAQLKAKTHDSVH